MHSGRAGKGNQLSRSLIGAFVAATALWTAAPAGADPVIPFIPGMPLDPVSVAIGAPCGPGEVNSTGVAPSGTTVRCVAGVTNPGLSWEVDNAGIQQIGRLQSTGLSVAVTKNGTGQRNCAITEAAAPSGSEAAAGAITVTLDCVE